jgi:hypothetical protein
MLQRQAGDAGSQAGRQEGSAGKHAGKACKLAKKQGCSVAQLKPWLSAGQQSNYSKFGLEHKLEHQPSLWRPHLHMLEVSSTWNSSNSLPLARQKKSKDSSTCAQNNTAGALPAHACGVLHVEQLKLAAAEHLTQPALPANLGAQRAQPGVVHLDAGELPDDALEGARDEALEQVAAPGKPEPT